LAAAGIGWAHQYVIKDWREVDVGLFDAFVGLIKAEGYRATYRAYYPLGVWTYGKLEIQFQYLMRQPPMMSSCAWSSSAA
jgi:hypothetical protein